MDLPIKSAPILRTQKSIFYMRFGETGRHKGLKIRRHPLFLLKLTIIEYIFHMPLWRNWQTQGT